ADKGFRIIVPQDACSTMNADWHRASIEFAMGNVAQITTTEAVLRAFGRSGPTHRVPGAELASASVPDHA
ncbi:MAG: isochorismatase family protein, partial [Pseudomonadota bacterium]